MTKKLLKRHKIITDAYERILAEHRELQHNSTGKYIAQIPLMDVYALIAEQTGYSPDYCADIIRLYLRQSK